MHRVQRQSSSTTNVCLLLLQRTFLGVGGEGSGGVTNCNSNQQSLSIPDMSSASIVSEYAPILKSC